MKALTSIMSNLINKFMARQFKWFMMASGILLFTSCYYDKEEILYPQQRDCTNVPRKFDTEVKPVMLSRCATGSDCHGAGSTNSGGVLNNYQNIKNNSVLIRHVVLTGIMPKGSSLTSAELNTIVCWIDSGSPQN